MNALIDFDWDVDFANAETLYLKYQKFPANGGRTTANGGRTTFTSFNHRGMGAEIQHNTASRTENSCVPNNHAAKPSTTPDTQQITRGTCNTQRKPNVTKGE